MNPRFLLLLEFILLCVALPTVIIVFRLAPLMFFFLWAAAAYCFLIYRRRFFTGWRDLWRWEEVNRRNLGPILLRWLVCCVLMTAFLAFYDPGRLFGLAQARPEFLLMLFMIYPVLSALPQEFIFCTFFFDRYKSFFGAGRAMMVASAVVFAYAHVLYINPVAPVLGFFGGLIFAGTYARTRSLALVSIEHGLYGNALFAIGLGWYFWSGGVN